MPNPLKGEVAFDAGGEGYTLSFGINAMIEAEQAAGMKLNAIFKALQPPPGVKPEDVEPDFKLMRALFWAALTDHQPDITEREAGRIMSVVGLSRASELIAEAVTASQPEAAEGTASPRKPARTKAAPTG